MPTFNFTEDLAIGGRNNNVIAGEFFELINVPTRIQIYAVAEGAGIAEMEVFFGQELELSQAPVNVVPAAGGGPRVPDDQVIDDVAAPQDRLVIRLTETGGAAVVTVRGRVVFTPLAMRR